MKRFPFAFCLAIGATAASLTAAQVPGLIDRPTPPPCAADGTCYPNTKAWGYYPVRWRTWPGVGLEPIPAKQQAVPPGGQISPELTPHETPPPELEDAAAPPASTKRPAPPAVAPSPEGEDAEAEGESAAPPRPAPPAGGPTSDADPPPAFPLSFSPRPINAGSNATTTRRTSPSPTTTVNDPPPAPPWGHSASL